MPPVPYSAFRHRFAAATVGVTLVTLVAGALVTSKNAGMAFRDWPTSDGRFMLTYPWLADFARDWDKFLEHGHRLAGMLIGLWSIALAALLGWSDPRRWVKVVGVAVLVAVIAQGVLGGFRVWLDERGLAMVHGAFAACVLSLMAFVATSQSRAWIEARARFRGADVSHLKPLALITLGLLAGQYLLGGLIRHQGSGLYEHLVFGIASSLFVLLNSALSARCGVDWVRRSGWLLLLATLAQVSLGVGSWITKFGLATWGYVAIADSIQQVAFRTAHAVVGMLLIAVAAVHAVRVFRVDAVGDRKGGHSAFSAIDHAERRGPSAENAECPLFRAEGGAA